MNFIALWPLLLAQVTVMSLTVIFLAADRRFFSWDCFVVCTLSMMMAEGAATPYRIFLRHIRRSA